MRVAVITEIVSPYRTPVFNLLAEEPDIDLLVIYLQENVPERSWEVHRDAIRFPYLILRGWSIGRGGRASPVYISVGVRRALERFHPDVIISGGYHHSAALAALRHAGRRRRPMVLWSESTLLDRRPKSGVLLRYKRAFVRRSDRFVVPGTAARDFLVSLGAAAHRVWVAPNAVDNRMFASARRRPAEGWTVVYVGRLLAHKRVSDLIEAFAPLEPRGVRLRIVGDGPDEPALRSVVRRLGLSRVEFTGFVQPSALPGVYAGADVLVLPSQGEPWGLVVNEAMAAGLPVLVSRGAGSAKDLVVEGVNGHSFHPGDVGTIRRRLEEMVEDRRRAESMGERGREIVECFSPSRSARGFAEAIRGQENEVFGEFVRCRESLRSPESSGSALAVLAEPARAPRWPR